MLFVFHRQLLVASLCIFVFIAGCQDSGDQPRVAGNSNSTEVQEIESDGKKEEKKANEKAKPEEATTKSKTDAKVDTKEDANADAKGDQAATRAAKGADDLSKPSSLFDGKTLEYWEEIEFGGEGAIYVEDGVISFEMGDPFTGIASTLEDLPKTNFEVSLEARKTQGVDFFCGLTFPVAESHCTLILGGWGGDVCGLSCIDEKDASTNDTSSSMVFKKGQWYKIRVRVEPEKISAWVDDKQIVNANIAGKTISLRGDTTLCEPMGIASFQTNAQYKNIELRTIKQKVEAKEDADQ